MPNIKKYVITSITLGLIAAASAGLIGLADLATKNKIEENKANKIKYGLQEIFGKNATILDSKSVSKMTEQIGSGYKYLQYYYSMEVSGSEVGVAFRTSGSNTYGKITIIIGFEKAVDAPFKGISVVENEQTYKSVLEENYIDPLNGHSISYDDTSCGATYGAKLIQAMIVEAREAAKKIME